jgi:DNA-directed RNA polymerase
VYATVIDRVLSNEFKKMKELNKYLLRVSNICSELGLPIVWTVPSGLNVKQKYLKSEAIELKPFKYSRTTFSIKKLTKVINTNKQNRALMPNLVHSLDASSLCLLVDGFYNIPNKDISQSENLNFFSIHDCFATTCNKFNHLINILKAVYIQTYCEETYLKKYDEGIINNIILAYGKEAFDLETRIITINVNDKKTKIIKFPDVNKVIQGDVKAIHISKGFGGIS